MEMPVSPFTTDPAVAHSLSEIADQMRRYNDRMDQLLTDLEYIGNNAARTLDAAVDKLMPHLLRLFHEQTQPQ